MMQINADSLCTDEFIAHRPIATTSIQAGSRQAGRRDDTTPMSPDQQPPFNPGGIYENTCGPSSCTATLPATARFEPATRAFSGVRLRRLTRPNYQPAATGVEMLRMLTHPLFGTTLLWNVPLDKEEGGDKQERG